MRQTHIKSHIAIVIQLLTGRITIPLSDNVFVPKSSVGISPLTVGVHPPTNIKQYQPLSSMIGNDEPALIIQRQLIIYALAIIDHPFTINESFSAHVNHLLLTTNQPLFTNHWPMVTAAPASDSQRLQAKVAVAEPQK